MQEATDSYIIRHHWFLDDCPRIYTKRNRFVQNSSLTISPEILGTKKMRWVVVFGWILFQRTVNRQNTVSVVYKMCYLRGGADTEHL